MTFDEALAATTADCRSLDDKIKRVKVQLDAMENALFDSAGKGGVIRYKFDTGQTRVEVETASLEQLQRQYRSLYALYNELCGIRCGSNVMVIRDGGTLRR